MATVLEKMDCCKNGAEGNNSYALVTYIPNPLGAFLDDLRRELVPGCMPHAHVTILPPRPLECPPGPAWEQLRARLRDFGPFVIEPTDVEIFSITSVIYIAIGKGWNELQRMHEALEVGPMAFQEPHSYYPHITLAQQLTPEQIEGVYELARRRWAEFPRRREFLVDTVTFVQNSRNDTWIDLAECTLGAVEGVRR